MGLKLKRIFCVLFGHSRIQDTFMGYYYYGRCDAQVGDALGSIYNATDVVIVNHKCEICIENYKTCTWKDKFLTPNPFKKKS